MTIHYYKKCEFNGYFSEHTADKEKVTCKRCRCKHKLGRLKTKCYLVNRNGYYNVLTPDLIRKGENVLAAFNL